MLAGAIFTMIWSFPFFWLLDTKEPILIWLAIILGHVVGMRAIFGAQPAFYTELFSAFPDNAFALSDIVVGPQGVFEAATLTGTNQGPWAGVPATGLAVALEVLILFPWDHAAGRFAGERIWFDRGGG